jgi:cyclopropane-fatty-acyl-phospholipid synthase
MDTETRTSPPTTRSRRDVGTYEPSTPDAPTTLTPSTPSAPRTPTGATAATAIAPLLGALFTDGIPVRFEFWDGSSLGPDDGAGTVHVRSADAINRLLWAPGELGLARAYVTGDLELEGDLYQVLRSLHAAAPPDLKMGARALAPAMKAARQLGALRLPLAPPIEEAAPRGRRHSKNRDAAAINHHYDISNEFYRLVLGPSMTYSCARFTTPTTSLEAAQAAKHELVCRKLGMHERPGMRLLDVGCGWGSMALHAARHHDARVVGVTLSKAQARLASQRVAQADLDGQIEIRVQDYRDLRGERFDVISSIGMFEHVGAARMAEYFATLHGLLTPTGRLLNHAISSVGGSRMARNSFIGRYVFPDGELIDVGQVLLAMEQAGFEVRDVESLREHYSRTLHAWVGNLQANWDAAVKEVGVRRARVWLLYMVGSANGFDECGVSIHQVLGVKDDPDGRSGMPPTRAGWS